MADETPRSGPRLWVKAVRTMALTIGSIIALLILIALFFGDRLIFFPMRAGDWGLTHWGKFPIEEVAFTAADGRKLVSWHVGANSPRCTILFFHGNAGNITHRVDILGALARLDANVLIVGYHGYGKSEGSPSEQGLVLDAEAAYRWLTEERGVPPARIVLYGESLGGAPAIGLASTKPCGGLIIQSSFTSIRDMARRTLPVFPAHWFMRSKMDNLSKIGSVTAPKLFFATKTDEVVPYAQTRRLYEAAPEPRTWVEFGGCGHNDLFFAHGEAWSQAIGAFLDQVAPREK